MKKILFFVAVLVLLPFSDKALALPGATDEVRGVSLLVPFFEVGIGSPHDTLLVVNSASTEPRMIHYDVWSVDGELTDSVFGNIALAPHGTWSASMANLINSADPLDKDLLTDGAFYRGFVTIDLVMGETEYAPTWSGYPFDYVEECLEGFIYYVRLLQGSANGLDMIPIGDLDKYRPPASCERNPPRKVGHNVWWRLMDFSRGSDVGITWLHPNPSSKDVF